MTDTVLNQGTDLRILSFLNEFRLPNLEKITAKMFEQMTVPPEINYIGNMNKSDMLY